MAVPAGWQAEALSLTAAFVALGCRATRDFESARGAFDLRRELQGECKAGCLVFLVVLG